MIKLAIFDFDGTLVDTAPDIIRAVNEYIRSFGIEPPSETEVRLAIGNGLRSLMQQLLTPEEWAKVDPPSLEHRFIEIYERHQFVAAQPFEGAREFLESWPGKIAILSNKREQSVRKILEHLGMHHHPWSHIVGGDTYHVMKPDPYPFQEVLKAAKCEAHEAIMIGDGHPDIEGALNSGIRSIAVEFGYSPIEELKALGAHYTLPHFSQLPSLLQSIMNRSF